MSSLPKILLAIAASGLLVSACTTARIVQYDPAHSLDAGLTHHDEAGGTVHLTLSDGRELVMMGADRVENEVCGEVDENAVCVTIAEIESFAVQDGVEPDGNANASATLAILGVLFVVAVIASLDAVDDFGDAIRGN